VREIVNTWDQLVAFGGDRIAILYNPQCRGGRSANIQVFRMVNGVEYQTDPKASWYNYGKKTFLIPHPVNERRGEVLAEAIAWTAKYGLREFVRNRLGDYVEREVNERFPIPRKVK